MMKYFKLIIYCLIIISFFSLLINLKPNISYLSEILFNFFKTLFPYLLIFSIINQLLIKTKLIYLFSSILEVSTPSPPYGLSPRGRLCRENRAELYAPHRQNKAILPRNSLTEPTNNNRVTVGKPRTLSPLYGVISNHPTEQVKRNIPQNLCKASSRNSTILCTLKGKERHRQSLTAPQRFCLFKPSCEKSLHYKIIGLLAYYVTCLPIVYHSFLRFLNARNLTTPIYNLSARLFV
jgi:hypothetical protein